LAVSDNFNITRVWDNADVITLSNMENELEMIEIPTILDPVNLNDPVSFTDLVLAQLVIHAPASVESILPASPTGESVSWRMTRLTGNDNSTEIANSHSRIYRAILARLGHHYMDDQLYCGFTTKVLRYNGDSARCFIYIGNCSDTGFWVRAFSRSANA